MVPHTDESRKRRTLSGVFRFGESYVEGRSSSMRAVFDLISFSSDGEGQRAGRATISGNHNLHAAEQRSRRLPVGRRLPAPIRTGSILFVALTSHIAAACWRWPASGAGSRCSEAGGDGNPAESLRKIAGITLSEEQLKCAHPGAERASLELGRTGTMADRRPHPGSAG